MASSQMKEVRERIAANNAAAAQSPQPSLEDTRAEVLAYLASFPEISGAEVSVDRIKDVPVE
ncbi:MAG: hypothetical protein M3306_25140 [Actinomycetota bacterium]|nr:hypothetical protein [Actinomycetota bacterium]